MLTGLRNANVYPPQLSPFQKLIDPEDNYISYRQQYTKDPGVPFLVAHGYELLYGHRGKALSRLFQFVSILDLERENRGSIEDDLRDCKPDGERLQRWNIFCI